MKDLPQFEDVWYASEEKALSSLKSLAYDFVGDMVFVTTQNKFEFRSKGEFVAGGEILSIELGRQRLNWQTYLLMGGTTGIYMMARHQSVIYVLGMILISSIIGIVLFWYPSRWIVVTYKDTQGTTKVGYFADGGYRGYSGLLGGTKKMYETISIFL